MIRPTAGRGLLGRRATIVIMPIISMVAFLALVQTQAVYEEEKNYKHPVLQGGGRCNEWEFTCKDGNCIARYDQCDGIEQCPDGSDEEECQHRYEQHPNHPQNSQQKQANFDKVGHRPTEYQHSRSTTPSTNNKEKGVEKGGGEGRLPMEMLLIGASAFVIVAVVVHIAMKTKRRKNIGRGIGVRGFRKGESLVDDEDDLLISQAYS